MEHDILGTTRRIKRAALASNAHTRVVSTAHTRQGNITLKEEHLWSLWPYGKQEHATEFERVTLPLHTKEVRSHPIKEFRDVVKRLEPARLSQFDKYARVFEHPEEFWKEDGLSASTEQQVDLTGADVNDLLKHHLIRQLDKDEQPKARVATFSVPEKASRRRWIVVPRWLNNTTEAQHFSISTEQYTKTRRRFARTADIKVYYHTFQLGREQSLYFTFHFEGEEYAITTIPTGARQCPGMAQIFAEVIAKVAACGQCDIDVYIDNIRFAADSLEDVNKAHTALMTSPLVEWNPPDESETPTRYEFLGVIYDHHEQTVKPGTRVTAKVKAAAALFACDQAVAKLTLAKTLSIFGVLMHASRVLGIKLAEYYYILKFMRRRTGNPLKSEAHLWLSTYPLWRQWINALIEMSPRKIHKEYDNDPQEMILYSDASDKGWGVVIIRGAHVAVVAGEWFGHVRKWHINAKELLAAIKALTAACNDLAMPPTKETPMTLRIDNTSAMGAMLKGWSRSFQLNVLTKSVTEIVETFKLRLTIEWVSTHENLADGPSRGSQRDSLNVKRSLLPPSHVAGSFQGPGGDNSSGAASIDGQTGLAKAMTQRAIMRARSL